MAKSAWQFSRELVGYVSPGAGRTFCIMNAQLTKTIREICVSVDGSNAVAETCPVYVNRSGDVVTSVEIVISPVKTAPARQSTFAI